MIRVCPHSDSKCRHGMSCTFSCATGDYDGTKRPMTPTPSASQTASADAGEGLSLARRFHETYERLAPSFGYETRDDTKAFDPTTPNGRLMIAVCGEMAAALRQTSSEPVAWQRFHPTRGWRDMDAEDVDHYRAQGQQIRALYAAPAAPEHAASERVRVLEEALKAEREWHDLRAGLAFDEARECNFRKETSAERAAMAAYNLHSGRVETICAALNPQRQEKGV